LDETTSSDVIEKSIYFSIETVLVWHREVGNDVGYYYKLTILRNFLILDKNQTETQQISSQKCISTNFFSLQINRNIDYRPKDK